MMCKDTFYTVCAVQTQCTMEQVDEFSNQANAQLQSKIKTAGLPALSKIGFYLRELHPCLFGELKHIFGTHPFNTDIVFFDMDDVYSLDRAKVNPKYNVEEAIRGYNSRYCEE